MATLHSSCWDKKLDLSKIAAVKGGLTLSGASRAAYRTGFRIDELDIYFDAGHTTMSNVSLALIGHGHADHIFSIASFFLGGQSPTIVAPKSATDSIINMVAGLYSADFQCSFEHAVSYVKSRATFKEISSTEPFDIQVKPKIKYQVQPYRLDHSIDTYGYGLKLYHSWLNPIIASMIPDKAQRSKIIPAIKKGSLALQEGLSNEQIAVLNGLKDSISVETLYPQIVYLADTAVSIMDNEDIYQYPVIVVECTFYDKEDLGEAAAKKHIHYNELVRYIKSHPNTFILTHSSCKYTDENILAMVTDAPPNMYIWLDSGPIVPSARVVPLC